VQPLEGHDKLLEVLGFTLNGSTYEWIPPYASASASADPGDVMSESSWIDYFRHVLSAFSLVKSNDDYKSAMEALAAHFTENQTSTAEASNEEDEVSSKADSESAVTSSE
jgi:hypothetical protein